MCGIKGMLDCDPKSLELSSLSSLRKTIFKSLQRNDFRLLSNIVYSHLGLTIDRIFAIVHRRRGLINDVSMLRCARRKVKGEKADAADLTLALFRTSRCFFHALLSLHKHAK